MATKCTQAAINRRLAEIHNGRIKPMETYTNMRQKTWFKCIEGHMWESTFNNVVGCGTGCSRCALLKVRSTDKRNKITMSRRYIDCIEIELLDKDRRRVGVALIDSEDYDLVKDYRWFMAAGYVRGIPISAKFGKYKGPQVSLHRVVVGVPSGKPVFFLDSNHLDCRKYNLRVAKSAQKIPPKLRDLPRGVTELSRKRFRAQLTHNGQHYHLGVYRTPAEAAKAYDRASRKLRSSNIF